MTNLKSIYNSALQAIKITIIPAIVWACSTSKQIQSGVVSSNVNDSVLIDSDGNNYPVKILRDNKVWMTTNLKLVIPGSYCYNDTMGYCELYGRLYTWESAQKACISLGDGWQLPTKDDWQLLAGFYGGEGKDSNEIRKRAFHPLLNTGTSGFNAVLGGGRTPEGLYTRMAGHGFYWTKSEHDSSMAWFANFAKGSQSLYLQHDGEKIRAFSVRCVRSK